jgi:hypothetical protein
MSGAAENHPSQPRVVQNTKLPRAQNAGSAAELRSAKMEIPAAFREIAGRASPGPRRPTEKRVSSQEPPTSEDTYATAPGVSGWGSS